MEYYCYKCGSPLNEKGKCPQCDENFYCYKCGEKLNETGKCPKCDAVVGEQNEPQPQAQATENSNLQQPQPVVNYQKKPSVFVQTFKQIWNLICNFFSRNTLDAVSEQYKETLPIWAVIFVVPVLLDTIYSGVLYGNIFNALGKLTHTDFTKFFGVFDLVFIVLIVMIISIASQIFSVYFFSKIQKKPLSLKSSANLVAGAYIPIALCSVVNLLFGMFYTGAGSVFSTIGSLAFIMLLSASLTKAHNQEKPYFWRVLAVYGASLVVTMIVSFMIIVPFVVIKTLSVLATMGDVSGFAFNLL